MSWLAHRAIDLAGAVTQFYYSRKYRALARHLGRPTLDPSASPGFIIIQIDGLSYSHVQQALAHGLMPHLRRALDDGRLHLARWRCGLPSTTPAVQAGLLYGYNFDIPGFRWYEKESGVSVVCKRPDQLHALAGRLSRGGRGLLRGGSSYTNLFDGDASLAVFTVSVLGSTFFDNVRGLGFASLFLLSPGRVWRILARSTREYARDLARRMRTLFRPVTPPIGGASLFRIVIDVVCAEIQTFGVMLDIYRGVPAIYVTYFGYDDLAHHYGPDHPEAMRALRDIDACIHQIDRMRTQYRRCAYDLYLLSDHGISAARPFEARFGQTLGQFILNSVGERLALDERVGVEKQPAAQVQYLLQELEVLERRLSQRGASVVRRARRALERRAPADPEFLALDIERRGDIIVRSSGGLAHVYFNVAPRRLDLSELALLYPALLNRLMEHPGIGLVVGCEGRSRESGETVIMGPGGTRLHTGGQVYVNGMDPLATLPDPETAARDLVRLASFPHSGDLIVLGAWHADGSVVNFEQQAGAHGGLGGPQDEPFIIMPAEGELAGSPPPGPIELHVYLSRKYRAGEPPAVGPGV